MLKTRQRVSVVDSEITSLEDIVSREWFKEFVERRREIDKNNKSR